MIERNIDKVNGQRFDVAIIGAGVYGIATALEAARRGLRPVLLERADFGGATSWNSLRILHGGLRYLQTLDVPRFRESVRERRWFCWHFPELIRPLPCVMPLYGRGLKRTSTMRTALWMNDHLSRHRNHGVASHLHLPDGVLLDADETAKWFPLADRRGLQGGALWYDAVMVNSQRVLMEMLRWACGCGATALNYAAVDELATDAGAVRGVAGEDVLTGRRFAVTAPVVINCAGPGGPAVLQAMGCGAPRLFVPSLAFNVLLDRPAVSRAAVAVQAPGPGSPVWFVQPWRGRLLAGTSHAPWRAQEGRSAQPSAAQVSAMLEQLNAAVPGLGLTSSDVRRVYAGLLPAAREGSVELATRPAVYDHRQHRDGPAGLVSVSGVKFTTARAVAEQALRCAWTPNGPLPDYQPRAERPVRYPRLDLTCPEGIFRADEAFTRDELMRTVREEAVVHLDDLLLRRTDWACDGSCEPRLADRVSGLLATAGCSLERTACRHAAR